MTANGKRKASEWLKLAGGYISLATVATAAVWALVGWVQDVQSKEDSTIQHGQLESEHAVIRAERSIAIEDHRSKMNKEIQILRKELMDENKDQRKLLWQIWGKVK